MKPDLRERFMDRFTVNDNGCWDWQRGKNAKGYGYVCAGGTNRLAHRVSYELHVGPIPEGFTIDHLCRNRACVNPAHLEPVSQGENSLRGDGPTALNARKTHCKRGHEFTSENTYTVGRRRWCRTCRRARQTTKSRQPMKGMAISVADSQS